MCSPCKRSDKDWTYPRLGSCSCSQYSLPLSICAYHSPHIQGLFEGDSRELETPQEHWTQVDYKNDVDMERVGDKSRKYFDEVLMKHHHWGDFFSKF